MKVKTVKIELEIDVVTEHYDGEGVCHTFSPETAAETVRAALYKTYADPTRETAGIEQVRSVKVV